MLKEIRLKDNQKDNGEVDIYANSYFINTEHITYFCTQGKDYCNLLRRWGLFDFGGVWRFAKHSGF